MRVRERVRSRAVRQLRVIAAAGLAASAYLHVELASGPLMSDGQGTLAGLFAAQALLAGAVAVWLLLARSPAPATAAALVGAGSLAAVVLTTYLRIPAVGPFPVLYDPFWYGHKVAAALSAALALGASLAALSTDRRARSRCVPTMSPGYRVGQPASTVQPLKPHE